MIVGLLKFPADDIELPVKIQSPFCLRRAADEALEDGGHAVPGPVTQHLRRHRHLPPAQEIQPFLLTDDLKHLFGPAAQQRVLGKKEHAHAVVPLLSQGHALLRHRPQEEPVGYLEHQTHAVPNLTGGVLAGPVLQLLHNFQRVVHRPAGPLPPDADDGADAAGVMLVLLSVQPALLFHILFLLRLNCSLCMRKLQK